MSCERCYRKNSGQTRPTDGRPPSSLAGSSLYHKLYEAVDEAGIDFGALQAHAAQRENLSRPQIELIFGQDTSPAAREGVG